MIAAVLLFLLGWFGVSLIAVGLWSCWRIDEERRAQRRAIEELNAWVNATNGTH